MNLAVRIVMVLDSEQARMTTSYLAVLTAMGASHKTCKRYVLKALDDLMEMKVIAADRYKTGYVYRMASVSSSAEVREIKFGRPRKTTVTKTRCNQSEKRVTILAGQCAQDKQSHPPYSTSGRTPNCRVQSVERRQK